MEIKSPLEKMIWLLGEWKGQITIENNEMEASFEVSKFGNEFIFYEIKTFAGKKSKILEKSYFFYDKTKDKILTNSFYEEGFSETSNWVMIVTNEKNNLSSSFLSGYNLPPNMELVKEIILSKKEGELMYSLKLGKSQKSYFYGIFRK